jgi:hypothetical protein
MASNINIYDKGRNTVTLKSTETGGVHTPHHNVDSIAPGSGATNLGKAQDGTFTLSDVGVAALGVRKNTPTSLATGDGKYTLPIYDANGRLYTNPSPGTGATDLGKAEDAAHSDGDVGVMALGVRKDTPSALAGTDGDYIPPIFDANGRQYTNPRPGTAAADFAKAEDAAHSDGDVGVMALGVRQDSLASLAGTDGDYTPPLFDADGRQYVLAGHRRREVSATPTVDTSAYASGDLIGAKITLANAVQVAAGSGELLSLVLSDLANQKSDIDVVLFDSDPSTTTFTDQAALDIDDADLVKVIGVISIAAADYVSFVDNAVATLRDLRLGFKLASGTSLYAALVCRGTPTYASSSDLKLRAIVNQD